VQPAGLAASVPVFTGAVLPAPVKSTEEFAPEDDNLPKMAFGPFTTSCALPRTPSANNANARPNLFMLMA
jgi:hypothetical protein